MAHVRERSPLRESVEITTPSGKKYRWADDEYRATNVPVDERWSDTMPGGYETHDVTLPRKPAVDYSDLDRLSTLTRYDAAGGIIWQGRLERAPRVSGDQVAISPSAVGWQAHLDDDKSVRVVYVDRDLTHWQSPSVQRLVLTSLDPMSGPDVTSDPDPSTATSSLRLNVSGQILGASGGSGEAWYDAGAGALISGVILGASAMQNIAVSASWVLALYGADDDHSTGLTAAAVSVTGTTAITTALQSLPSTKRWVVLQLVFTTTYTGDQNERWRMVKEIAVIGDHGLTLRGTSPEQGFYDADIIGHAISQWCPMLNTTSESLSSSTFVIPQVAFLDPTTVSEIVRQAARFGLRDWAVWDDKTFWLHDRGARGRSWRARTGPSQLEETGPQVDRLWNSIIVAYQDVDGSTRTVGPLGSGADTEDDTLTDDDPENPANKAGIVRRDMLTMGTSTAAGAIEVGRRFLEESKALDSSGRAVFVGYVEDDRGVMHPYSHVHAGDTVVFMDAADTSPRRIVRTDKTRQDRSCSVDIDSPPEGLQALLERLGVVLVPLGA